MTYELGFLAPALKEWHKLDKYTQSILKKKLQERCKAPRVPSAQLSGYTNRYKIKLRGVGYRLVYEVRDKEILIVVIAVGRRDRSDVYKQAQKRI